MGARRRPEHRPSDSAPRGRSRRHPHRPPSREPRSRHREEKLAAAFQGGHRDRAGRVHDGAGRATRRAVSRPLRRRAFALPGRRGWRGRLGDSMAHAPGPPFRQGGAHLDARAAREARLPLFAGRHRAVVRGWKWMGIASLCR